MQIHISHDEEGLPVLEVLRRRIPGAPEGYLRRLLRSGKIRWAEATASEQSRCAEGDLLRLPSSARLQQLLAEARSEALDILFENREILAVCKPPGLAVHRGQGHQQDNLALRVEKLMARRGVTFRSAPVHRLDLETSGPLLFAKGRRAAGELGKLFMAGEAQKIYWGLATGRIEGRGRLTTAVRSKGKLKEAVTDFSVMATRGDFTLLEMRLRTGRTHQIRRQLAEAGHPLVGDRRYGGAHPVASGRLFLHCCRLSFVSPFDGSPIDLRSALPADLSAVLEALGFAPPQHC